MATLPHGYADSPDFPAPGAVEGEQIDQQTAGYVPQSPDPEEKCMNCEHFVEPDRCLLVSGMIDPGGRSELFTPRLPSDGNIPSEPVGDIPISPEDESPSP